MWETCEDSNEIDKKDAVVHMEEEVVPGSNDHEDVKLISRDRILWWTSKKNKIKSKKRIQIKT